MKKIFMLITLYYLLFNYHYSFAQSGWTSIGASGSILYSLHFNSNNDTLYAGTVEGYRFYSLYSNQWIVKEMTGYIGRTVFSVSTVPGRYSRVLTGRINAFFKGYIELNDNFSVQGTIVRNSQGGQFMDIKYFPDHPDTLLACGFSDIAPGDLVKSTNGGTNWFLISGYLHTAMTQIAVDPVNTNICYVSGDGKITKSTDYGNTWSFSFNGLPFSLGCYCVAVNPFNTQLLLTSNDNGIFRTTDGGQNWNQVFDRTCRKIVFHPNSKGVVAGITFSPYRLLFSTNFGLNWTDSTSSFPGPNMVDLLFSRFDNNLYVASSSSGIYKRLFTITGLIKENNVVPADYKLFQNYPNPFNPNTKIKFDISKAGFTELKVFDVTGQEIETIVNSILIPGSYEAVFDGSNQSSGLYFYKLTSGDFIETKKMILVK